MKGEHEITRVLRAMGTNQGAAAEELLPLVYKELRRLAQSRLAKLPPGQTLQATALVHEAWMRIVGADDPGWDCREQFFGAAARAIREILIEQARRKGAVKRDAGRASDVDADHLAIEVEPRSDSILALDAALKRLEELKPRHGQLVSLRFFGGLPMKEIADILGVPLRTAERDWSFARAWLREQLSGV